MNRIEIGQIVKPQGLMGELKVKPFADEIAFKSLDYVYLDNSNVKTKVNKSTFRLGFAFITLDGVVDRTMADNLRGKTISIDRDDLIVKEGELIIDDMLDMKVFLSTGENVGEIISIEQYGSADIITISGKFGKWQVPYIADLVESVDKVNKVMVLNAKRFEEVKV